MGYCFKPNDLQTLQPERKICIPRSLSAYSVAKVVVVGIEFGKVQKLLESLISGTLPLVG